MSILFNIFIFISIGIIAYCTFEYIYKLPITKAQFYAICALIGGWSVISGLMGGLIVLGRAEQVLIRYLDNINRKK